MAGEVAVEVSSSNGKINEQCSVDMSPCHDLPNGSSVDCNGLKSKAVAEGTENGKGKEDADRTYVFVNVIDATAEISDNDENFVKTETVECAENCRALKFNGETEEGGSKINGCNGHCCFEELAVVRDEVVEVESEKGKDTSDENADCGVESTSILVAEDSEVESDKCDPVEEVHEVNSAELKVLGVVCEEKFKAGSSSEVIERVSESKNNHGDAKGSSDCREPSDNKEELPGQVKSTSEIQEEVPESQAVNGEQIGCLIDCKDPVESTVELSEKVECNPDVVEVVSESHSNADGLNDTKDSSKISKQLSLQAESSCEVFEGAPNSHCVSHMDADNLSGCKESSEPVVDLQPLQVESASDIIVGIPKSQAVSHGDVKVTGNCKELPDNIVEDTIELSKQAGENQECEVKVTDISASELAINDDEELEANESRSNSIEEKVEGSSQLNPNADVLKNQESVIMQASDTNNDVEWEEESVEMATESSTIDQLRSIDVNDDQFAKPSACLESSDIETASSKSPLEKGQCLETAAVPYPISLAKEDGDSIDANLDAKEPEAALGSDEVLTSSAECDNVPIESARCSPIAEETVATLDADATERSLAVPDEISSPNLNEREPASELEEVKEQAFEAEIGNAKATSSADAELESEAQDGSAVADDISATHCPTESSEAKICFGSISLKELSSISIQGRSFEAKCAVDVAASQASPDMESPENNDNDKPTSQGAEVAGAVSRSDGVAPVECSSVGVVECSSVGVVEAQPVVIEVEKRFFNYLVRVPRYDGEELKKQINDIKAQVDEKTRHRDAIQSQIQMIKATRKGNLVELEDASSEERSARDSLKSKWQEIDTVQSVVNKVKNAMSLDDIDNRIQSMEHRIQHETLQLKEEKLLLREIKQLKQFRDQLSSNMGKQDELKEALEQKEQTEERLRVLRKEAELLRGNVSRAEVVTKAVKKKHYDGNSKLQELQDQFKAADAVRQEAYQQLKGLRAQLREKNKYFYKYKDDATILSDLGFKGDQEGVFQFCIKQVEDFMELWNNNAEFRSDYIRCSLRGTLKRLGTTDGRSLGVDEQRPVIPPYPSERVGKDKPVAAFPSLEQAKARAMPVEAASSANNALVKPVEQKEQISKAKAPATPTEAVVLASTVSVRDVEVVEGIEEQKQAEEEDEKAKKEEELRKEEEAAWLKEQCRLEERAKAEAAIERKKRNVERAQARAAARVQKEAEQKEKEREKRLKKKERKKAAGSAPADAATEGEPAPSSQTLTETPKEPETGEKVETAAKRLQKPTHFTKQAKVKSTIPAPLRNRGKRKMQQWMWILLITAIVLALFLAGNGRQLF